jgi:hypothetical protein
LVGQGESWLVMSAWRYSVASSSNYKSGYAPKNEKMIPRSEV